MSTRIRGFEVLIIISNLTLYADQAYEFFNVVVGVEI
jgi:hypothetical protein